MKNKKWWKAAGARALRTTAQTAIAMISTSVFMKDVHWLAVVSASVLSGILSLLNSVAGLPELKDDEADWRCGKKRKLPATDGNRMEIGDQMEIRWRSDGAQMIFFRTAAGALSIPDFVKWMRRSRGRYL